MFEIRKNLDLRKILGVTKNFLKSRFVCIFKRVDTIVLRYGTIHLNNKTDLMETLNLSLDDIWNEFFWFNGNGNGIMRLDNSS